jgi:hypothetical protein
VQTDVFVLLQFPLQRGRGSGSKFTLLRLSWRLFLRSLTAAVRCSIGTERVLMEKKSQKGKNMGVLWIVLFVVVWVALQAYILPKLGIST